MITSILTLRQQFCKEAVKRMVELLWYLGYDDT